MRCGRICDDEAAAAAAGRPRRAADGDADRLQADGATGVLTYHASTRLACSTNDRGAQGRHRPPARRRLPLEPDAAARRALGAQPRSCARLSRQVRTAEQPLWSEVLRPNPRPDSPRSPRSRRGARLYRRVRRPPRLSHHSPRFLAYIPGGGLFHSSLGTCSPRLEQIIPCRPAIPRGAAGKCDDRLAGHVIGFSARLRRHPDLGGSISNLTAIVAPAMPARRGGDGGGGAVYTPLSPPCIDKRAHAAAAAPRAHDRHRCRHRMSAAALAPPGGDVAAGIRQAGDRLGRTVDTGAHPARRDRRSVPPPGAWFHVDGAYAGCLRCATRAARPWRGSRTPTRCARPHKTLFPALRHRRVLVRDRAHLLDSSARWPTTSCHWGNPRLARRRRPVARNDTAFSAPCAWVAASARRDRRLPRGAGDKSLALWPSVFTHRWGRSTASTGPPPQLRSRFRISPRRVQ